MKLYSVIFVIVLLPYCYLLQVTEGSDKSLLSHFVFPKDRKSTEEPRIVGGQEASPHAYPFQVALLIYYTTRSSICGGSLISNRWILTAAHCVHRKPNYMLAVLGAHNLTAVKLSKSILNCTEFIVHPDWNYSTLQNDVALVKLPRDVTISTPYVNTVDLANGSDTYANATGIIIGWGVTNAGNLSVVLRQVSSVILSNEQCAAFDPFQELIIDSHLCVSGSGGVGSCYGDSGGPLLVDGVQVGIVSFGYKVCVAGKPSVFTRLTDFHDWITMHTTGAFRMSRVSYKNPCYLLIVATVICLFQLNNVI